MGIFVSVELAKSAWRAHSFCSMDFAGNTSPRVCFEQTWQPVDSGGEKKIRSVWKENQRPERGEGKIQKGMKGIMTSVSTDGDLMNSAITVAGNRNEKTAVHHQGHDWNLWWDFKEAIWEEDTMWNGDLPGEPSQPHTHTHTGSSSRRHLVLKCSLCYRYGKGHWESRFYMDWKTL